MWVDKYIGIPYAKHGYDMQGFNCWGLYWYVLKHEFGKDVPSYKEHFFEPSDAVAQRELSDFIDEQRNKPNLWRFIYDHEVEEGDCIVLLIEGKLLHCGVVVDPKRFQFLHILNGANAHVSEWNHFTWSKRVRGFYRYVGS